jgi:hypothetical protein
MPTLRRARALTCAACSAAAPGAAALSRRPGSRGAKAAPPALSCMREKHDAGRCVQAP